MIKVLKSVSLDNLSKFPPPNWQCVS